MDRRRFIKLSALTGTSATLASCGNPDYRLIRYVPEDQLVPGVAVWKPSICPLCPAACGVIVRVMEGDAEVLRDGKLGVTKTALAKKLEGDPNDPISQGKLCTRGQAAIEITYHPDRVGHPLKRAGARGEGKFEEISWEQAISEVVAKLDGLAAANDQKSFTILSNRRPGMRQELLRGFATQFGALAPVVYEVFHDDVLRHANLLSFGHEQLPTLELADANYVISFGADFLGTWNSPVAQNVAYGHMRQGRPNARGRFVQVEYRMSQTGANADEWVAVKPGTEGVLALGIAHEIMKSGARKPADAGRAGTVVDGWSAGLIDYSPEEVEKRTGVKAARIARLAKEFAENKPALAFAAGAALAQTNGLFTALAVNALNALVDGVISFTPGTDTHFVKNNEMGVSPQVVFIDGANPVFASPKAHGWRDRLMKVPFIVSFGSFIDETSALADLILPDHSFLESAVHAAPESGAKVAVSRSAPAVMRPLHETRSTSDVLLDISKKLSKPLADLTAPVDDSPQPTQNVPAIKYADAEFDGDATQFPFHLLPYPSIAFLDGSLAHLPLLQELPDPMSSAIWSSWAEINIQTADRLGIKQGDILEITTTQGSIRVPAFPSPGIAPDVIAIPAGQGHDNYTRYATGRGANPISILAPVKERETGALAWAATRAKVTKVAEGDGSLVMFSGSLREYPGEKVHR